MSKEQYEDIAIAIENGEVDYEDVIAFINSEWQVQL